MRSGAEKLSLAAIESRLSTKIIGRSSANELWDVIGSTNTRASELAVERAAEGVFVLARQQTAGRGRLGRTWASPPDAGVYVSVLLKPNTLSPEQLAPITLSCGVAAARAVEKTAGVQLGLKWVNDLVYSGRKIGGILAEMASLPATESLPAGKALIVGFGLNLRMNEADVPEDLIDKMGWLERIAGMPVDANILVANLLQELETAYDQLKDRKSGEILKEWRSRSVTLGSEIVATSGSTTLRGTAVDIDDSGALLVKSDDGETHCVHAGEVMVRRADGKYI
jgi:BirA family biotin operon repressor/biotin-[acetyl-CoA-carboxylase] ligase